MLYRNLMLPSTIFRNVASADNKELLLYIVFIMKELRLSTRQLSVPAIVGLRDL